MIIYSPKDPPVVLWISTNSLDHFAVWRPSPTLREVTEGYRMLMDGFKFRVPLGIPLVLSPQSSWCHSHMHTSQQRGDVIKN